MLKIIDYQILIRNCPVLLKNKVLELLQENWQPFGSLTIIPPENKIFHYKYCQVLVKYE